MICPYCKLEMKKGYIYNGRDDLRWTPEDIQPSLFINFNKNNEIILSKSKYIFRNKILTYRCSYYL